MSVIAFIISIYIYSVTQSELGVGKFNLIMSAVSLLAFFFLNRTVRVANRMKFALIGSIMVFFGIMTLSFFPNTWGVVIFNLALAIFNPFWAVPFGSISFEIISSLPQGRERRVEFIVAREIPLGIGRLLSLATFLLLVEYMSSWSVTTYMLRFLSVILVISWWILNRYTRNYSEQKV